MTCFELLAAGSVDVHLEKVDFAMQSSSFKSFLFAIYQQTNALNSYRITWKNSSCRTWLLLMQYLIFSFILQPVFEFACQWSAYISLTVSNLSINMSLSKLYCSCLSLVLMIFEGKFSPIFTLSKFTLNSPT